MLVLIIDNGEYTGFAERLAQEVDVAYFSPWARAYPYMRNVFPGFGLPNVTRVNDPFSFIERQRPDLVCIPDLFQNDLDQFCRHRGIPTFSSGEGNQLETDREFLNEFLHKAGLPAIPSESIAGIDALKEYLQDPKHENCFVKLSTFRGDFNTFHHKRWESTSVIVGDLAHELGPLGPYAAFLIQQPIEDAVELSIEGIFVDGALLSPFLLGYEIKDAGEVAAFQWDRTALPPSVQGILQALSRYFAEVRYRNFFAIEIRLTKDEAFLLDVACRIPIPPGASLARSILNLADVLGSGGEGRISELDVGDTKIITEVELNSPWTIGDFLQVHCPPEYRERLSLRHHCQVGDDLWCIPRIITKPELDAFGAAFGLGKSIDSAGKECSEVTESIDAYQMYCTSDFQDKAIKQIAEGRKVGVDFPED